MLDLKTWSFELPPELLVHRSDSNRMPQAYTLQMVYHTSFLLLMKPFLPKRMRDPQSSIGSFAESAIAICDEASRQICVIARKYQHEFGSFRRSPLTATHCSLSAVLYLLSKHGVSEIKATDRRDVQTCLKVLEELGESWQPPRRYWKNLRTLVQKSRPLRTVGLTAVSLEGSLDESSAQGFEQNQEASETAELRITSPATSGSPKTTQPLWIHSQLSGDIEWSLDNEIAMTDAELWPQLSEGFGVGSLPDDYHSFDILNGENQRYL